VIRAAFDCRRFLFIGAHSDDIEIGCGGTALAALGRRPDSEVLWVVLSAAGERRREAVAGARLFLSGSGSHEVIVKDFRDGYFPYQGGEVKDFFEDLKRRFSPEVIFTHFRGDRHQDHRLVSDLTWNTWRDQLVLEYEVPKWDGDLGSPNVFFELGEDICARKIGFLLETFKSQAARPWFAEDTFRAMLRLRGVECAAPSRHAEAFYCRKLVLGAL
jgi:LmbE family N-acetylglucosaminyl deacetylase